MRESQLWKFLHNLHYGVTTLAMSSTGLLFVQHAGITV